MKSAGLRQILYDVTYLWSLKKYSKLGNITKKKHTSGYSFHFILLLPDDHIAL